MRSVAVLGASGRMGRLVLAEVLDSNDLTLAAAVGRMGSPTIGVDAGILAGRQECGLSVIPLGPGAFAGADVVIDFSLPEGLLAALPFLGDAALVSGTTGLDPIVDAALTERAAVAPVLTAANFSTGVNLLLDLVARAARALPGHDIEIVEVHHRHKRDAPSGTALALGRSAADARDAALDQVAVHGRIGNIGARSQGEIGIHAVRSGGVVGDHSVTLGAAGETLELRHSAISRSVFAQGAITAARWLSGRAPGRYDMKQVLGIG